uniref:Uncharacterized protein n=1 Tax=Arundo donax TaxID=35708 RepID=A0A0A9GDD5_ARUDO
MHQVHAGWGIFQSHVRCHRRNCFGLSKRKSSLGMAEASLTSCYWSPPVVQTDNCCIVREVVLQRSHCWTGLQ